MRAVIYCRVSTQEQTTGLSLDTQREAAEDYCRRQGWEVDRVFMERGESAKNVDRTQLNRLLSYCRKSAKSPCPVRYVVVYRLDRFARDKEDHFAVRAHLSRIKISLRSVTEAIDDSSTGKFMEGILASAAQFDNDVRAERCRAGMKANLERGRWMFQAPVGYQWVDGEVQLDPDRAPLVREGFKLFARGTVSQSELFRRLRDKGLTSPRGTFHAQTLAHMLRNPFYAGRVVVRSLEVDRKGIHTPLVDARTFQKVQARLDQGSNAGLAYEKTRPDFPLRRFVMCGGCERFLTAGWSKGRSKYYGYYNCQTKDCREVKERHERMEEQFVAYLTDLALPDSHLRLLKKSIRSIWSNRAEELTSYRTAQLRRLSKIETRREKLVEAYLYEGLVDRPTYERQLSKLQKEKSLAESELAQSETPDTDIGSILDFAERMTRRVGTLWREADFDRQLLLQSTIFPDGVVYRNGAYRTASSHLFFNDLQPLEGGKKEVVSPTGFEPVLPP